VKEETEEKDVPGRYLPALRVWAGLAIDFLPNWGEGSNLDASPTWEVCQPGDLRCISSLAIVNTRQRPADP